MFLNEKIWRVYISANMVLSLHPLRVQVPAKSTKCNNRCHAYVPGPMLYIFIIHKGAPNKNSQPEDDMILTCKF